MPTENSHVRPSTLKGIKRLAKNLKTEYGSLARAQDAASCRAGYENFEHARRALTARTPEIPDELALLPSSLVAPATAEPTNSARKTPKNPRRTGGRTATVPYWTLLGGSRKYRRPNARMPVDGHRTVGRLLKEVMAVSYYRKGVLNRLESIRCTLDEWAEREYNHAELSNEVFFELYYHGDQGPFERSLPLEERGRHIKRLKQARTLLEQHYPDCAPLRSILGKLDAAIKSMQSWR